MSGLGGFVERRQRLIHQQQPRLRQQRAAERDALAFAAGESARRALKQRRETAGDRPPRPSATAAIGAAPGGGAPNADWL